MFGALTDRSIAAVEVVRELVAKHEELLTGRDAAVRLEMKRYSVSSAVTRLYAIYEHFVETLVSDYIDAIPELCAFADLPETMRKEYRIGISHLLGRLDGPRYSNLSHEELIKWYHEALSAHTPYRLIPQALTRHDENLRLPALERMLRRIQVDDVNGWFANHDAVASIFPEPGALLSQVESELRNFVQLRNDAAHGTLASLPGPDILLKYCSLIEALLPAMAAYLHREMVLWRHRVGRARLVGRVTEVFARRRAFVVPLEAGGFISLEETVHLVGQWSCHEATIESIQLDDEDVCGVGAHAQRIEVGLRASIFPKRQVDVYADVRA